MSSVRFIALLVCFAVAVNANTPYTNMHCCQIDPPAKPIFNSQGHLLHYEDQPCPEELRVCCKGLINIVGSCITLEMATQFLPNWEQMAKEQGITLAEAIIASGLIVG